MSITQTSLSKEVPKTHQRSAENCPECASKNLVHDYDTGETICGDCGLVLYEQMLDKGPEWRAFTQQEKASRSRVGTPTSYSIHDKGLSTTISQIDRDAFGRKLPQSTRLQMWRLTKMANQKQSPLIHRPKPCTSNGELERLSSKVNISPPIREKAALIYRKALDKGLVRGRSINAIAAAALYAACRKSGSPRSPSRNLLKQVWLIKKMLQDATDCCYKNSIFTCQFLTPLTYVSKIAEKNGVSGRTQGAAIAILAEC